MIKHIKVETVKAPKAIGPYSQAIIAGDYIFCSGQIALRPDSNVITCSGITKQTHQVISNLKNILVAAGSGLDKVIKTEVYLKSLDDFKEMNEVYSKSFTFEPKPSRATVEVAGLPKGALIEISCIAYKK